MTDGVLDSVSAFRVDGVVYRCRIRDDGGIEIVEGLLDGSFAGCLQLPSRLGSMPVVSLAPGCFAGRAALRKVCVPSSVRTIGKKSFANCVNLTEFEAAEGLECIGEFAFMGTALERLEAPSTLKTVGKRAFYQCDRLEAVRLNEGILEVNDEAFARSGLALLEVPFSVEHLGRGILSRPSARTEDFRPRISVREGGRYAVDEAGGLYERRAEGMVLVEMSEPMAGEYRVAEGTVAVGDGAFSFNAGVVRVHLPEGLRCIGADAFRGCRKLCEVSFPETLEEMGPRAFAGTSLERAYLPAGFRWLDDTSLSVTDDAFGAKDTLRSVEVHPGCRRYYVEGGLLCERLGSGGSRALIYAGECDKVEISDDVVELASCLFMGTTRLRALSLHDGVGHFDPAAFVVNCTVDRVEVRMRKPVEGRSHAVALFPRGPHGRNAFVAAFEKGDVDVRRIFACADEVALLERDPVVRGRRVLERLVDSFLLEGRIRARMEKASKRDLPGLFGAFARLGDVTAFSLMLDLGIVNAGNIDEAVGRASVAGDASVTGYLLDAKARLVSESRFDFEV